MHKCIEDSTAAVTGNAVAGSTLLARIGQAAQDAQNARDAANRRRGVFGR
jgi:hypothetical protein